MDECEGLRRESGGRVTGMEEGERWMSRRESGG